MIPTFLNANFWEFPKCLMMLHLGLLVAHPGFNKIYQIDFIYSQQNVQQNIYIVDVFLFLT